MQLNYQFIFIYTIVFILQYNFSYFHMNRLIYKTKIRIFKNQILTNRKLRLVDCSINSLPYFFDTCSYKSNFEDMIAGIDIDELGLLVMVGPSLVCDGFGIFMACSDDIDTVTLPGGTTICGYSKGIFANYTDGDKTVNYLFSDPEQGVIFEKELMTLSNAIEIVHNRNNHSNINHILLGHNVIINKLNSLSNMTVTYDPSNQNRYFIPNDPFINNENKPDSENNELTNDLIEETIINIGPTNLGIFANDIAYKKDQNMTLDSYLLNANNSNILELVWRLEEKNNKLVPTWPVVILSKDVIFTNKEFPIEAGITNLLFIYFIII